MCQVIPHWHDCTDTHTFWIVRYFILGMEYEHKASQSAMVNAARTGTRVCHNLALRIALPGRVKISEIRPRSLGNAALHWSDIVRWQYTLIESRQEPVGTLLKPLRNDALLYMWLISCSSVYSPFQVAYNGKSICRGVGEGGQGGQLAPHFWKLGGQTP